MTPTFQEIHNIKQRKASDWTDELINDAINTMQLINPSIQLIEIIRTTNSVGTAGVEIAIKAEFNGNSTMFQCAIRRAFDCIEANIPLTELVKRENELFAKAQDERNRLATLNAIKEEKAAARLIVNTEKTINILADEFAKAYKQSRYSFSKFDFKVNEELMYHAKRILDANYRYGITGESALTVKADGEYIIINRFGCFVPQAFKFKFVASLSKWKCKNEKQAECIEKAWNARIHEILNPNSKDALKS